MTDPCRNSACRWHDQCPLRPLPIDEHPRSLIDRAISPTGNGSGTTFSALLDQRPYVGELSIRGTMTTMAVQAAIADAESDLPGLDGLLLVVDSMGGPATAGMLLEALVLETKRVMPVVSFIMRAYSAALSPALASTVRIISPDGGLGSIGSAIASCDGSEPTLTISRATPEKLAGMAAPWPPWSFCKDGEDHLRLQQHVDKAFETEFKMVSFYARRPATDLRTLLAKSHIAPGAAALAGLVDGVMRTEGDALRLLLKLATRAKNHNGRTST